MKIVDGQRERSYPCGKRDRNGIRQTFTAGMPPPLPTRPKGKRDERIGLNFFSQSISDGDGKKKDSGHNHKGKLKSRIEKLVGGLDQNEKSRRTERIDRHRLAPRNHAQQKNRCHRRCTNAGGLPSRNESVKKERWDDGDHRRMTTRSRHSEDLPEDERDHSDVKSRDGKKVKSSCFAKLILQRIWDIRSRPQDHSRKQITNHRILRDAFP